jgi:hypothetical protein
MRLTKSLLLGSAAAVMSVAGAQAADLPSRKAAPASYVKICDAYGAGFFYIPGTDTCVRLGGYVRAEYQFTPGHDVLTYSPAGAVVAQRASAQDTTGMEMRGRINLDARTATPWGTARTFIRLRMANTSGIRRDSPVNNGIWANGNGSSTGVTLESALIQWAGFTFGVAPENYAFMPSMMYHSNPWTGFPNGMKQLAYTARFGGGLSATVAIEDKTEWGYAWTLATDEYVAQPSTGYNLVGNIKWDQPWGFAVLHGALGNNSVRDDFGTSAGFGTVLGATPTYSALHGSKSYGSWAIGTTWMFNLPMLAPGDRLWLTANYTHGLLGTILSNGSLNNLSTSSNRRQTGGILRIDQGLVTTGGAGTAANPYTLGTTTGWNVSGAFLHYWAPRWRSQVTAGYVQFNPPTSTLTQWGKGHAWEIAHGLVFSPAKDFDIGLEFQYMSVSSTIQNPSLAYIAQGQPGLKNSTFSSKLRVQRAF